ncbi:unnamed protein product [Closterium sp. NIES-65]|nr:unnamed protein product [Closterium sp. NIES-65]
MLPRCYAPSLLCSRAAMLPHCHAPSLLCSLAAMLPRCYAPTLLCSLAAIPLFWLRSHPVPKCTLLAQYSTQLNPPLAARVLEECAAAWGSYEWGYGANVFPPPEWRVGGDCDTADLIRCDANGLIIEMWIDNSPIPDSRYGDGSLRHNDLEGSIPASFSMLTSLVYLIGQSSMGQSSMGQSSMGQSSMGQSSMGQSSMGQSSMGQSSMGQSSTGQSSMGQSSIGQSSILSGAIPPGIGALTALRELGLSDNQLSGVIPPAIGALTSLSYL